MKIRHRVVSRTPLTAIALLGLASLILLTGCGGSSTSASRTSAPAQSSPADQAALASGPMVPAGGVAAVAPTPLTAQPKQEESLPPDIEPLDVDSLVTPGQGIVLSVLGTPDVSEVALSDGRGDTQYFFKDPTSRIWRVQYRVPLAIQHGRLALSVTARNDDQRWRRRWVFLQVQEERPAAPAESSGSDEEEGCAPQS